MKYHYFINNYVNIYLESGNIIGGVLLRNLDGFLEVSGESELFYVSEDRIDFIGIPKNGFGKVVYQEPPSRPVAPQRQASPLPRPAIVKPGVVASDRPSEPSTREVESPYFFRGVKLPESPEEAWEQIENEHTGAVNNMPSSILEDDSKGKYHKPDREYKVTFDADLGGPSGGSSE